MSSDGLTLGKTRYGLIYHRLKNRSGKIFAGCTFIYKRLNVGFRKNTTSSGDRIYHLIILCENIKPCSICMKKRCHLIDEGTGSACTDTIHSLVDTTLEINDLGILAAKLYSHIRIRTVSLQCCRNGHNLLTEGCIHVFTESKSSGARNHRGKAHLSQLIFCFLKDIRKCPLNIRMMTTIIRKQELIILIHDRNLNGCRTYINSKSVFMHILKPHLKHPFIRKMSHGNSGRVKTVRS